MNKNSLFIGASLIGAFALGMIVITNGNANNATQSDPSLAPNPPDKYAPALGPGSGLPDFSALEIEETNPETVFSDLQEDDIRKIVKAYLLDHPEVLVEAIQTF